ncbi:MAG: 16S rRNA (adenine(1518)-N(6)/adenine(1519)-N(6))-dimethyltransferase RsmA [Candidatus Nanopelagicales bacterium]
MVSNLLGAADVRRIAEELDLRPTKKWGQNFVIDPNTVRRIVRVADVSPDDVVLEVGPGVGSLTLALLETGARVVAVEIDPRLAERLPATVAEFAPETAERLVVMNADAMDVSTLPWAPTALVANLPYNVAVPVVLHLLAAFPSIQRVLVMVQREVAERLCAEPGSRTYGVPSVKARWFGDVSYAGDVGRSVFWPAPNVDSGLVSIIRRPEGKTADRERVFAIIDAAFGQRRKKLRTAVSSRFAGDIDRAMQQAGLDRDVRGEQLDVDDFVALAGSLDQPRT